MQLICVIMVHMVNYKQQIKNDESKKVINNQLQSDTYNNYDILRDTIISLKSQDNICENKILKSKNQQVLFVALFFI